MKFLSAEIIGPLTALVILVVLIGLTTSRFLLTDYIRNIFFKVSIVYLEPSRPV